MKKGTKLFLPLAVVAVAVLAMSIQVHPRAAVPSGYAVDGLIRGGQFTEVELRAIGLELAKEGLSRVGESKGGVAPKAKARRVTAGPREMNRATTKSVRSVVILRPQPDPSQG